MGKKRRTTFFTMNLYEFGHQGGRGTLLDMWQVKNDIAPDHLLGRSKTVSIPYGFDSSYGRATSAGGGKDDHMIHLSGLPHHKVPSDKIIQEIISLVENKSKELKKI